MTLGLVYSYRAKGDGSSSFPAMLGSGTFNITISNCVQAYAAAAVFSFETAKLKILTSHFL